MVEKLWLSPLWNNFLARKYMQNLPTTCLLHDGESHWQTEKIAVEKL